MKSFGVVCSDIQRWNAWAKTKGRVNRLSRHAAEGDDWKARRLVDASALCGFSFDEIVLLPGFEALDTSAILANACHHMRAAV